MVVNEWEVELEKKTYIINSEKLFKSLNIHATVVPSIVN